MTSINIDQYYKLADDIQAVKKRDKHLVAEQCLDVYPMNSTAVRQHVRKLIVKHLSHICCEDNQGMCHNGCGRVLNTDAAAAYFGEAKNENF
tara:strand:+ start:1152 stop:1427 length:276 start_codon:yes stop_codon:yes gene_type:complete